MLATRRRDDTERGITWADIFGDLLKFGGQPLIPSTTWPTQGEEQSTGFDALANRMIQTNPVVFSAFNIRMSVFAQARLVWLRRRSGKVVDQFGDQRLAIFEKPWLGGTTSDLLARMELHNTAAGNAFVRRGRGRLHLMRPDWVKIILGSRLNPDEPGLAEDAEVAGYLYDPPAGRPKVYLPDEVAHYAPTPDPDSIYRGMSWLRAVVDEVHADDAATTHKDMFWRNAATPNLVVKFDSTVAREEAIELAELIEDGHTGLANAFKTLYLGGGADAEVVGATLQEADLSKVQGKGETRILMAAGVHAVIAGASEGLAGSSLNSGNYNSAKRAFSDIHLQHLWQNAVASLSVLVDTSDGVELWFDKSEVPFLQDDLKDTADIQQARATAISTLVTAGYESESVVDAITNDDYSQLEHTGLFSVQLHEPGTEPPTADPPQEPDDDD